MVQFNHHHHHKWGVISSDPNIHINMRGIFQKRYPSIHHALSSSSSSFCRQYHRISMRKLRTNQNENKQTLIPCCYWNLYKPFLRFCPTTFLNTLFFLFSFISKSIIIIIICWARQHNQSKFWEYIYIYIRIWYFWYKTNCRIPSRATMRKAAVRSRNIRLRK